MFFSAISVLGERKLHHRTDGLLDSSQVLSASFFRPDVELIESFHHARICGLESAPSGHGAVSGIIDEINELYQVALQIGGMHPGNFLCFGPEVLQTGEKVFPEIRTLL